MTENSRKHKKSTALPAGTIIGTGKKQGLSFGGRPRKPFIILAAAVVVLGIVAFVAIRPVSRTTQALPCSEDAEGSLLRDASNAFDPADPEEVRRLGEVVSRIEQTEKHDQDPNCLYIAVMYYITVSDPASARPHLDKLQNVYKPEAMNLAIYKDGSPTLEELQNTISTLEKISEQNRQQNIPSVEGPAEQ